MMPSRVPGTTVLLVLAVLSVIEVGLRFGDEWLSGDLEQIHEAPAVVTRVADSPGLGILMVGNSHLGRGVQARRLEQILDDDLGKRCVVGEVTPDGSSPIEWRYLLRKMVFRPQNNPDLLVLAFGPGHLWDRAGSTQVLRLAAHYVDWKDVGSLFRENLTDTESRGSFLVAHFSRMYALRDRIQLRLLDFVVPHFRSERVDLLRTGPSPSAPTSPRRTYRNLEAILQDATAAGIPVVLLPIPGPDSWVVQPEVLALAGRFSAPVLDIRSSVPLGTERFPDGEHLDPTGRDRFTEALGEALVRTLPGILKEGY